MFHLARIRVSPAAIRRAAVVVSAWFAVFAMATVLAADAAPDVTHDGLERVAGAKVALAYVKPGADFTGYTKVTLLPAYVAFRKHWQRDHRRVSHNDMERIKRKLAELFRDTFTEVLEAGGYPVVEGAGPDVLLLRPAIIDLDVSAPDTMEPGRVRTFTSNAGAMTLYLELFDSETGDILARAADRKAGRDMTNSLLFTGTTVHNRAEAERVLKQWATLLKQRLDEFHNRPAP
jgi:hypothetical protein